MNEAVGTTVSLLDLEPATSDFLEQAIAGLSSSPHTLPSKFFYDERGSNLFQEICELPEYYVTRTETEILRQYGAEIADSIGENAELVGFGTGAGVKTRMLIDSGATVTAISHGTARAARINTGRTLTPIMLRTANGVTPAETGSVDELRAGNIVARNLKIVTAPGMGELDVLGMNFLSQLQSWRVEGKTLILVPHHPQTSQG